MKGAKLVGLGTGHYEMGGYKTERGKSSFTPARKRGSRKSYSHAECGYKRF